MLKMKMLSLLLLMSTVAVAQIKLDLSVAIRNENSTRNIITTVILDENDKASITCHDDFLINISAQEDENFAIITINVFEKTDANELVCIAQPTIQAQWNESATLTIKNSDTDQINISIIPSRE